MLHDAHIKTMKKYANVIARSAHYHSATTILFTGLNKVVSHVCYGYRKYTTGEYVSNKYRDNFGWKNTYYQQAETIVSI